MFQPYQQEAITEKLSSIIQRLQSEKKSGTLTVQRDDTTGHEEGQVIFVQGKITQATAERLHGSEAFRWMSSWGKCRYTFVSSDGFSSTHVPSTPVLSASEQDFSAQSLLVPHRVRQTEEALAIIEYRRLSRTHRHVFLLINGQRTVHELVRFLKRDEYGVYELLRDLERGGLIKFTSIHQ